MFIGADQIRSGLRSVQLILDEAFGSFQIGDESHVSVIPGSLFPDAKDGCGMIGRERIPLVINAN